MEELIKSEYDGRLVYYNLYQENQRNFSRALENKDYIGMYDCVWLDFKQVVPFWNGGVHAITKKMKELRIILDKIIVFSRYDDQQSAGLEQRAIRDFTDSCLKILMEIEELRTKHRLLLPIGTIRKAENDEEYADMYEQETFGSVTTGDKELQSYDNYSLDYGRVDSKTKALLKRQRWLNEHKDADAFFIVIGYNNTGKSTLCHHLHTLWTEGEPNAAYCSFDPEQFAGNLGKAMGEKEIKRRVAHWDEANFSGRGAMTKYNRDVIDLYWSNRSEHGLHLWCNPSVEYLDKVIVKERVTAIFLIHRGEIGKPPKRKFTLITREGIHALWKNQRKIDLDTLEENAEKYGLYTGWFYEYPQGAFLNKYREEKDARNKYKNERLMTDHSDEKIGKQEAAKMIGVTGQTIITHVNKLAAEGIIDLDQVRGATGKYYLDDELIGILKQRIKKARHGSLEKARAAAEKKRKGEMNGIQEEKQDEERESTR